MDEELSPYRPSLISSEVSTWDRKEGKVDRSHEPDEISSDGWEGLSSSFSSSAPKEMLKGKARMIKKEAYD